MQIYFGDIPAGTIFVKSIVYGSMLPNWCVLFLSTVPGVLKSYKDTTYSDAHDTAQHSTTHRSLARSHEASAVLRPSLVQCSHGCPEQHEATPVCWWTSPSFATTANSSLFAYWLNITATMTASPLSLILDMLANQRRVKSTPGSRHSKLSGLK